MMPFSKQLLIARATGLILLWLTFKVHCWSSEKYERKTADTDTVTRQLLVVDSPPSQKPELPHDALQPPPPGAPVHTANTTPAELVSFSKTLIGVPYKYASTNPAEGFDCSGFITYVFNHFNIKVPRSSVDFTNVGKEIAEQHALPGDLILFTGTDSLVRIVGHMGIVVSNKDNRIEFIHSTSGKAKGVVITPLERYYRSRFVKIIRVFGNA
jgi:cell wall-associated NlpC family hydrolase